MFTDNHRRYLLNALRHLEQELDEALHHLADPDTEALFPRYRDPPAPEVRAVVRAHRDRLRAAMGHFMTAHAMPRGQRAEVDAGWAFRTRLALLRNTAAELRPRHLEGYGRLSAEDVAACRALSAELAALLDVMAAVLVPPPAAVAPASAGAHGAALQLADELIVRYGLYEYRAESDALRDASEHTLEIAVLGRVSSGKSSLVNALIGHDLLPVGQRPLTAVITRIRRAAELAAESVGLDGQRWPIPLARLAAVLEQTGPTVSGPRLAEVRIGVPSEALADGVVITDTPGLGAVHASIGMRVWDYLPRCDVGVLTVDATATLGPDDLDLLRALTALEVEILVVLSKCDLLVPADLAEQRAYTERTLRDKLSNAVPVTAVSIRVENDDSLLRWRDGELAAALVRATQRQSGRRQQRVQRLLMQLRASLLGLNTERPTTQDFAELNRQSGTLAEAEQRLGELLQAMAGRGVEHVVRAVAARWVGVDTPKQVDLQQEAGMLADRLVQGIVELLRENGLDEAARARLLPLPVFVPPTAAPQRVMLPRWLPRRLRTALAVAELRSRAAPALQAAIDDHLARLRYWCETALHALRERALEQAPFRHEVSDAATLRADLARLDRLLGTAAESAAVESPP